ncbi:MAG: hypothetical protein BRD23_07340, partial [Halobacteriales archaeon SW_9_67_25]
DTDLAARTRDTAPPEWVERESSPDEGTSAVEAFLDDEERITEIRERAREEAERRAAEWGFD